MRGKNWEEIREKNKSENGVNWRFLYNSRPKYLKGLRMMMLIQINFISSASMATFERVLFQITTIVSVETIHNSVAFFFSFYQKAFQFHSVAKRIKAILIFMRKNPAVRESSILYEYRFYRITSDKGNGTMLFMKMPQIYGFRNTQVE